jgi:hypothetical protein
VKLLLSKRAPLETKSHVRIRIRSSCSRVGRLAAFTPACLSFPAHYLLWARCGPCIFKSCRLRSSPWRPVGRKHAAFVCGGERQRRNCGCLGGGAGGRARQEQGESGRAGARGAQRQRQGCALPADPRRRDRRRGPRSSRRGSFEALSLLHASPARVFVCRRVYAVCACVRALSLCSRDLSLSIYLSIYLSISPSLSLSLSLSHTHTHTHTHTHARSHTNKQTNNTHCNCSLGILRRKKSRMHGRACWYAFQGSWLRTHGPELVGKLFFFYQYWLMFLVLHVNSMLARAHGHMHASPC